MSFIYEQIECQSPPRKNCINRNYIVIKAIFNNSENQSKRIQQKAWELAKKVNPHKANNSTQPRDRQRLMLDALGGVIAEEAWFYYINRTFGKGTVDFTDFDGTGVQIDLLLSNKKSIEIRASFPNNGVKFALCHEASNFRSICTYENLYKPTEVNKDFFGCTLFETKKESLIDADSIILYLVGGSTRQMMLSNLSYVSPLGANGDSIETETKYRVISLKDAMDMADFENYMAAMGYVKQDNILLNQPF